MKYKVVVSVQGAVYAEVEADNQKDAKRIAEEKVANMDFNCIEDIDLDAVDVWEEEA